MAAIDEKMSRAFTSTRTDRTFDETVRAADRAAERAAAIAVRITRTGTTAGRAARYTIRRVGVVIGVINLTYAGDDEGQMLVQLRAQEYLTSRPTFVFIPIGPKTSPALAPAERFGRLLAEELGRRP